MTIDATTPETWAASWLAKVEYILSDHPAINADAFVQHCAMCLPSAASGRRERVVALICADTSWPSLVAEVVLHCGGFDLGEAVQA
jgi:hypothetical protein